MNKYSFHSDDAKRKLSLDWYRSARSTADITEKYENYIKNTTLGAEIITYI